MATYIESRLRVELPDEQHFRFADLPAYKPLSGQHLKEMDFAWIENGKLYLLEVRSYADMAEPLPIADLLPTKDQPTPYRFQALVDKVTDSLLILLAIWAGSDRGKDFGNSLPISAKTRLPLKLVVALDIPAHLSVHLLALRDKLNERLRGRISLVDVRNVILMDYAALAKTFNPKVQATLG